MIPELQFFLHDREKTVGGLRIATVTVNPAVDGSTSVEEIVPDRKLRCADLRREPGEAGSTPPARSTSSAGKPWPALSSRVEGG